MYDTISIYSCGWPFNPASYHLKEMIMNKSTLERSKNPKTLFQQIYTQLKKQITQGEIPVGSQITPEIELAKQYQVSRTTIRQALAKLEKDGMVKRVQGSGTFVIDKTAQSVEAGSNKRIGVLLVDADDQLTIEILQGIEQSARSRGYRISLAYTNESPEITSHDFSSLESDDVSGFIVFPRSNIQFDPEIARLCSAAIPVVLVDRYLPALKTDYVVADNFQGGYRATEHLIILGHTHIGFIHNKIGNLKTTGVRDRYEGYRKALMDYGVPFDEHSVYEYPSHLDATGTFFDELLIRPNRPSAFFLVTDEDVPAFLNAARRQKILVPEDIAVVGFDNLRFSENLNPPLTTVAHPRKEIGIRAGHLLIDRIEGRKNIPGQVVLPTSLIVRESCGVRMRVRQSLARVAKPSKP